MGVAMLAEGRRLVTVSALFGEWGALSSFALKDYVVNGSGAVLRV